MYISKVLLNITSVKRTAQAICFGFPLLIFVTSVGYFLLEVKGWTSVAFPSFRIKKLNTLLSPKGEILK